MAKINKKYEYERSTAEKSIQKSLQLKTIIYHLEAAQQKRRRVILKHDHGVYKCVHIEMC